MRFLRKPEPDNESVKALHDATESLRKTRARRPEVREVARSLRVIRERNHFAEHLQVIMEGQK